MPVGSESNAQANRDAGEVVGLWVCVAGMCVISHPLLERTEMLRLEMELSFGRNFRFPYSDQPYSMWRWLWVWAEQAPINMLSSLA